jgi:hypothetical protein
VEAIVDALCTVSGNHKGVRASGAKGVRVKGAFTPSPEAPSLSKALHFTRLTQDATVVPSNYQSSVLAAFGFGLRPCERFDRIVAVLMRCLLSSQDLARQPG